MVLGSFASFICLLATAAAGGVPGVTMQAPPKAPARTPKDPRQALSATQRKISDMLTGEQKAMALAKEARNAAKLSGKPQPPGSDERASAHMEFAGAIHTETQHAGTDAGLPKVAQRVPPSGRTAQMAAAVQAKFQHMNQIMKQKAVQWQIRSPGAIMSPRDPRFSRAPGRGFLQKEMSEPEPHADAAYTGAVRNMVGSTFKNITFNPEKDVFVNCFAPWCGHCQNFKAPYMKLARKVQHVKTLDITQIDCTQNTMPGMPPPRGFPHIFFCAAGKDKSASKCQLYHGDRTPEDMLWFLHNHATHQFSDTPPPRNATADDGESGLLGPDDGDDL